jgi:hypothetical protein
MRKPVLVVTAYFIDAVESRLKQDFGISNCAARKTVLALPQKNCCRPPTGLMQCLSLRQTD